MRRLVARVASAAALSLVASVGIATEAGAVPFRCGHLVMTNVVLTADVGPCKGDGLVVKRSNVTVNLNGHRILGDGNPNNDEQVGIRVVNSRGVLIEAGTVEGFSAGIAIEQGSGNTVRRITARGNTDSGLNNYGDGIVINASMGNVVEDSTITGNGPLDGLALANGASGNIIRNNVISDNRVPRMEPEGLQGIPNQQTRGIRVETFSEDNVISGNTIERNGDRGIDVLFDDRRTKVLNNTIRDNGTWGIRVSIFSNHATISGNTITGNGFDPYRYPATRNPIRRDGLEVCCSGQHVITNNAISGNGRDGIRMDEGDLSIVAPPDGDPLSIGGTRIQGNTVQNNARNGIIVECTQDFGRAGAPCTDYPQQNQIRDNTVTGNGGGAAGKRLLNPAGTLVIGTFDLLDQHRACDSNTWDGNTFNTAFPACTRS